MRVLIVEDEQVLADAINATLRSEHIIGTIAESGRAAINLLDNAVRNKRKYDAVVLDLGLQDMDGLDVLRGMRRKQDKTPVLVLTARNTLADRVGGLSDGADDYLAKPYEAPELVARIRAIARRVVEQESTTPAVGNLTYEPATGSFHVDGASLPLSALPHAILEALFRRKGNMVTKEFLTNLDGRGSTPEAVDTQISRLRKRLRDAGASAVITTAHGNGYVLEGPKAK